MVSCYGLCFRCLIYRREFTPRHIKRSYYKRYICSVTIYCLSERTRTSSENFGLNGSNAKLLFRKKSGISGAVYYFHINDNEIYEDLLRLGLSPNKSLSLVFPNIEPQHVRHFIRGCWDGDGTVYWESNDPAKPRASFISGSKLFAEGILRHLVGLGLSDRKMYTTKSGRAFYFRFLCLDCARLYHVFYDGVPESMYLTRKYERFNAIANYFESRRKC